MTCEYPYMDMMCVFCLAPTIDGCIAKHEALEKELIDMAFGC